MHIAQYLCSSPETVAAVSALADLYGLERRISGHILTIQVDSETALALLLRTHPFPSAVVDVEPIQNPANGFEPRH
jgi:hypothetical protein